MLREVSTLLYRSNLVLLILAQLLISLWCWSFSTLPEITEILLQIFWKFSAKIFRIQEKEGKEENKEAQLSFWKYLISIY